MTDFIRIRKNSPNEYLKLTQVTNSIPDPAKYDYTFSLDDEGYNFCSDVTLACPYLEWFDIEVEETPLSVIVFVPKQENNE